MNLESFTSPEEGENNLWLLAVLDCILNVIAMVLVERLQFGISVYVVPSPCACLYLTVFSRATGGALSS